MAEQPNKGAVRLVKRTITATTATVTAETLELLEQQVKLLPDEDFPGADADVVMLANLRLQATTDAAKRSEFDMDHLDTEAIKAAVYAMPRDDLGGLAMVRAILWSD
jgi:hypothetical protein